MTYLTQTDPIWTYHFSKGVGQIADLNIIIAKSIFREIHVH